MKGRSERTNRPKKKKESEAVPALRRWTKKILTKDDYSFAVSEERYTWVSVASELWRKPNHDAKRLVCNMLNYELWRELAGNKNPPCMALDQYQKAIRTLRKDSGRTQAEVMPL